MIVQPIDWFLVVWFVIAAACAAYVAYDQFRGNPEPAVMKWGFVLVTLYMGPLGLLLYVMADKEPRPGTHEAFVAPLWKQSVGSTIHCCAGDATGIIVAAAITATLGLPMWLDYIVEYVAGFSFGLFIFQALFMRRIMGGSYLENVRRSFIPELISMNAMMAGMTAVMTVLMMGRYAGHAADRAFVLGRNVARRYRRISARLSLQPLDGRKRPQTWPYDRTQGREQQQEPNEGDGRRGQESGAESEGQRKAANARHGSGYAA